VASAATIALPLSASVVTITGTNNITTITASSHKEHVVVLKFAGALTVTKGSNLKLTDDFFTTADDTLALVCDGSTWHEIGRSFN
jgi:hypothetical protein